MSLIRRVARQFFASDSTEIGDIYMDEAGVTWLVLANGTAVQLGAGGGSQPPINWCRFRLTPASDITHASNFYDFLQADYSIIAQSGSDFSIGTDPNSSDGAIISAAGGQFQAAVLLNSSYPDTITLDGGSTKTRYITLAAQLGPSDGSDPNAPVNSLGIDDFVPILAADESQTVTSTKPSTIGYVPAGASVFYGAGLTLVNSFGTDTLHGGALTGLIWQTQPHSSGL